MRWEQAYDGSLPGHTAFLRNGASTRIRDKETTPFTASYTYRLTHLPGRLIRRYGPKRSPDATLRTSIPVACRIRWAKARTASASASASVKAVLQPNATHCEDWHSPGFTIKGKISTSSCAFWAPIRDSPRHRLHSFTGPCPASVDLTSCRPCLWALHEPARSATLSNLVTETPGPPPPPHRHNADRAASLKYSLHTGPRW